MDNTVFIVQRYWRSKSNKYDYEEQFEEIEKIFRSRSEALAYIKSIADKYEEPDRFPEPDYVYHFEENEADEYGPMDPGMHQECILTITEYDVEGEEESLADMLIELSKKGFDVLFLHSFLDDHGMVIKIMHEKYRNMCWISRDELESIRIDNETVLKQYIKQKVNVIEEILKNETE